MPWKGERDPYKIWLSEIILQQTRVEQGTAYYLNFIKEFPDIQSLARAEDTKVFKLWEGLGYYSRCRNLLATARYIVAEHKGVFPANYEDISKLKGVGPYTTAAIASFAYNLPYPVVDGNVSRVLARIFGIKKPINSSEGKAGIAKLSEDLLDKKNPGIYNQAIMDFGATVCKPSAPLCDTCVFNKDCIALQQNLVTKLPVKEKKLKIRNRYFHFFIFEYRNTFALRERKEKDIWQHLFEFPCIETSTMSSIGNIIDIATQNEWLNKENMIQSISIPNIQKLTHQTVTAVFITVKMNTKASWMKNFDWVKKSSFDSIPFPGIIKKRLEKDFK